MGTNQEKCLAIKCSIESLKYHLMCHKFRLAVENQSSPYANQRWNEMVLASHGCPSAHQALQLSLTGLNFTSNLLRLWLEAHYFWDSLWSKSSDPKDSLQRDPAGGCWLCFFTSPVDSAATESESGYADLGPETISWKLNVDLGDDAYGAWMYVPVHINMYSRTIFRTLNFPLKK